MGKILETLRNLGNNRKKTEKKEKYLDELVLIYRIFSGNVYLHPVDEECIRKIKKKKGRLYFMHFKIIKSKLKEDYLYPGVIKRHEIRDKKLLLFVEFSDEEGIIYLKSIPVDKREGSAFARFFEQIGLMDEEGNIDTS